MQRLNVPILPLFDVRTNLGSHKAIFKPPIYPREQGKGQEANSDIVREIVQEYTQIIESMIREYPEQYFWFHRRWKTKPKKKKKE